MIGLTSERQSALAGEDSLTPYSASRNPRIQDLRCTRADAADGYLSATEPSSRSGVSITRGVYDWLAKNSSLISTPMPGASGTIR